MNSIRRTFGANTNGVTYHSSDDALPLFSQRDVEQVPLSEFMAIRAVRIGRTASIAAGIIFICAAAFAWINLMIIGGGPISPSRGNFCQGDYEIFYPWSWWYGFNDGICKIKTDAVTTFANVFGYAAFFTLIGCAVISFSVGFKKIRNAAFINGIMLTAVTTTATIAAFIGRKPTDYHYYPTQWTAIILYLASVVASAVLIPMARTSSEKLLRFWRASQIVAMVISFVGIAGFSTDGPDVFSLQVDDIIGVVLNNFSDMILFAALIVLAFGLPHPSAHEAATPHNNVLFVTSALAVAEAAVILLLGFYDIVMGSIEPSRGSLLVMIAVYMVAAGVVGIAQMDNQSRFGWLMGLGVGLIAAQGVWFLIGNWLSHTQLLVLFTSAAIVYVIGAASLRSHPPKHAVTSTGRTIP